MSAAIIPFPAARPRTDSDAETLRQTRLLVAECWRLRAECRRIRRDYEERRKGIEKFLDCIARDRA